MDLPKEVTEMDDLRTAVMEWGRDGFCCSQIMLLAGLAYTGRENPDLVAAMNGLCRGGYSPGCTCGALTGACALFGFYAGKAEPWEPKNPELPLMAGELHEWFRKNLGVNGEGVTCGELMGGKTAYSIETCLPIVFGTLEKALAILQAHGCDLQQGRPGS